MGKQSASDSDDENADVETEDGTAEEEEEEEELEEEESEAEPNEEEESCEEDPDQEEEPCEEDPDGEEETCKDDPSEEEDSEEELNEEEASEEPDEEPREEDPSPLAQPSSGNADAEEHQLNSAQSHSDNKRATGRSEDNVQVKQKQDLNSKLESYAGSSGADIQNMTKNLTRDDSKSIGSSTKKRRSRWDTEPAADEQAADGGNVATKKRKTRWASDDSQLKMLDPLKLPDFVTGLEPEADLDPEMGGLRARLREINQKLMAQEICDDRPENERSPSPPPIYDELGIRINTREVRQVKLRSKLIAQRKMIIADLIQRNPTFKPPPDYKPTKFYKKLYIPVKEYPGYNFFGLIIGPRGLTIKKMEKETGARISLRGKGSVREEKPLQINDEDLHVYIEANTQNSLDAAVAMVEKLLVPVEEEKNELKRAQLRELAMLHGTYREENMQRVLKMTAEINLTCEVCGDASHLTAACPLTASTPGSSTNGQQVDSLTKLGSGVFFPFSGRSKPVKEIDEAKLKVSYLPQSVNDDKLRELFSPFGQICEATVIKDRSTGLSKGYGFVKYVDAIFAAEAAVRMDKYRIEDKILGVRIAGRPPSTASINTGLLGPPPSFTLLPTYPGSAAITQGNPGLIPAAITQGNPGPMDWPGPPGSMLLDPYASFPKSSSFLPQTDPVGCPASYGSSTQSLPSSSLISGGITSFSELAQFPGYLNSLDSHDPMYQVTPPNPLLSTEAHATRSFGSYQTPLIRRTPPH